MHRGISRLHKLSSQNDLLDLDAVRGSDICSKTQSMGGKDSSTLCQQGTHIQQVDPFCIQDPLVLILVDAVLVQVRCLQLTHEDLADPRNALQLNLQHATKQRYCRMATVAELPKIVRHMLHHNALCHCPFVAEGQNRNVSCSQTYTLQAGKHDYLGE